MDGGKGPIVYLNSTDVGGTCDVFPEIGRTYLFLNGRLAPSAIKHSKMGTSQ